MTATLDEALALAADVEGWMTDEQGRRLYAAAARCPAGGRIVEIGSFQGRSTIVLASAAPAGVEVVAIDPHAGNDRGPQEIAGYADEAAGDRAAFEANLARAGVADRVRHVASFSDDAHGEVDDPIDVLYIDGAHRYGPARADIRDWGRRVGDGGTMLIHDSFSSIGVTLAIVRELVGRPAVPLRRPVAVARRVPRRPRRRRSRRQRRPPARPAAVVRPQRRPQGAARRWAGASSPAGSGSREPEWPY